MRNLAVVISGSVMLFLGLASHAEALGSVSLQWDPNPEPNIAGYHLFVGPTSGNYTQQIDVGNTTTATVSNLVNGSTYFFVVTAYNTATMESPPSNEVSATVGGGPSPSATPTAPTAPSHTRRRRPQQLPHDRLQLHPRLPLPPHPRLPSHHNRHPPPQPPQPTQRRLRQLPRLTATATPTGTVAHNANADPNLQEHLLTTDYGYSITHYR